LSSNGLCVKSARASRLQGRVRFQHGGHDARADRGGEARALRVLIARGDELRLGEPRLDGRIACGPAPKQLGGFARELAAREHGRYDPQARGDDLRLRRPEGRPPRPESGFAGA
jgi:hypothetical protein